MTYSGLVFRHEHNWADPIPERLSWLSDVMTHRDGSEQRRTARLDPRRQLEYSILPVTVREKNALDNFLVKAFGREVLLPIWTDAKSLPATATAGSNSVSGDFAWWDFDAGEYAVLFLDWNRFEIVQLASVTTDTLTFTDNLEATWPAGAAILPARKARLLQRQEGSRYGGNVETVRLTFDVSEASRSSSRIDSTSHTVYAAPVVGEREVYTGDSDWSESLPVSYQAAFGLVDYQAGLVALDSAAVAMPSTIIAHSEKLFSRPEIAKFLGFLWRRAGRRVPFWLPTQENDFDLVSIGFNNVTVRECGYSTWVYPKRGHVAFIVFRPTNVYEVGRQIYRKIEYATDNGDGTETLGAAIASDFSAGDVDKVMLSLLRYYRLESDAVELTWHAPTIATCRLNFRELTNYPPVSS